MAQGDRIIAIIRRRKEDAEQAVSKFDELAVSSHIPQATIQRKQYAVATQIELLQSILDEIDVIAGEEYKRQQIADALLHEEF